MIFDYINDKTGFANGDLFDNETELRRYFTIDNMYDMFGKDYEITQEELDEMVEIVISNKWHMEKEKSRVFSIRVNLDDSDKEVNEKIDDLTSKVGKYRNF